MARVHLTGVLTCSDERDVSIVLKHLPEHVTLTRSESGCISFEVVPTPDPLVWEVDEWFTDDAAFAMHQARASASEWGRATLGIERRFTVEGA